MLRHLQLTCLLTAWLFATGCQWEFVQVFGWARMIVNYSKTMTLREAVVQTFTPGNECEICCAVRHAKQKETGDTPAGSSLQKNTKWVFQAATRIVFAGPAEPAWPLGTQSVRSAERAAPPVPPPRALV